MTDTPAERVTAVIGAMDEELEALLADLEGRSSDRYGPFTVHRGRLEGRSVALARCGVGKVNAAALTQAMLALGADRVVFTGVAGALRPGLRVGDLIVSRDALQHDLDATALGYRLGEVPGEAWSWPADPQLTRLALEAAAELEGVTAVLGRVASGDQFIADPLHVERLRDVFEADCAEMEGAAAAQVCAKWGVPYVIIRSISDTADQSAEVDFRTFTPLAAARAKQVVRGILRRLPRT
jgi:adenosylhomocysteine nucleosidase